jgi:hypothetical protein
MKKKEQEVPPVKNSLRTFKLFCLVVACIVTLSLVYRIVLLLKNSKFDGQSSVIVALEQSDGKKDVIYTFDPTGETVSVTTVIGSLTIQQLRQQLGIPIDISLSNRTVSDHTFPLELTAYSLYNPQEATEMTLIDAVRLWWLFRSTPDTRINRKTVSVRGEEQRNDELGSQFIDTKLENDKKTIAIVNATSVSGLGSRLERVLGHVGASVISITTAHQTIQQSKISYYGEKSYTVDRLSRILSYPTEQRSGSNVSDIIIEIGQDQQRTTIF